MTLRPRNAHLLATLEPFLVATPDHLARFDRAPFGHPIAPDACIDPLRISAAPFIELLARLDAITFGAIGMPMPRWAFLDVASLPGAIFGLARRRPDADAALCTVLRVDPAYRGLIPLSMYIAVPAADPSLWIGHNLVSLREHLPHEPLRGLGRLTKALALKAFRAGAQIGVTQWDSTALHVHTRMGPLALLTAWTPAHTDPCTLTYRADLTDESLRALAGDPSVTLPCPPPDLWMDTRDLPSMRALQTRLESGERLSVVGPPVPLADRRRVPLTAGP